MILVTGATGTVGRAVVDHLLAAGAQVRAVTRRPSEAALPDGVDVAYADLSNPVTLPAVMDGVKQGLAALGSVDGAIPWASIL